MLFQNVSWQSYFVYDFAYIYNLTLNAKINVQNVQQGDRKWSIFLVP